MRSEEEVQSKFDGLVPDAIKIHCEIPVIQRSYKVGWLDALQWVLNKRKDE